MILNKTIALAFLITVALTNCGTINGEAKVENNDTLVIQYLDTFIVGKQVFPLKTDSVKLKELANERILLGFESDFTYYVFYNKKAEIDFLSTSYWSKQIPRYVNKRSSNSSFIRVDYSDGPFLSGLYSSNDSIIVLTTDLKKSELKNLNEVRVSYFSTRGSHNGGLITFSIKDIISELKISDHLKRLPKYKVVLMEATSLISNAWYTSCKECYAEYSNAIVLSMTGDEIYQIQFLDSEYVDYLFKKKDIKADDIHYH